MKRRRRLGICAVRDATDLQKSKPVKSCRSSATATFPSYAKGAGGLSQFPGPCWINNVLVATSNRSEVCAKWKTTCLCHFAKLVKQYGIGPMAHRLERTESCSHARQCLSRQRRHQICTLVLEIQPRRRIEALQTARRDRSSIGSAPQTGFFHDRRLPRSCRR